jgi:alpha-tubulin suppressor-like RCC1 family protein
MTAGTTRAGRSALRRRATPAALFSLTTGLSALLFSLVPTPQAALAASHGASHAASLAASHGASHAASLAASRGASHAVSLAASHAAAALITAGSFHSCAIESGKAYCWGDNGSGQLGNGSTVGSSVPVAVDTSGVLAGHALTQITAGGAYTCALDAAGAAYCWGDNGTGQLGDGGTVSKSSVPVAVDTSGMLAGQPLTQITADGYHTCVLDAAGAAYCWGDNGTGQLGDGAAAFDSSVPVAVDTSGVLAGRALTQITAGWYDTCALDAAGAAFCWGYNADGELGDGKAGDSSVPVAVDTSGVPAGQALTQIAAGWIDACAVDSAGAAYCWGDNGTGQLGDGKASSSSVPVAVDTSGVLAGRAVTQITAGWYDTCALDAAGAAYCWGYNADGELGDGKAGDSAVPVAVDTSGVLAGQTLTQISAGTYSACAVDAAGAPYCWGANSWGQLGDDSATQSLVPVRAGPQPPASVTATPGDSTATVSWRVPASLDTGILTGYTATAIPGGITCTAAKATTCTITGLTNGTTYRITVVARSTVGHSGASAAATVTPQPSAHHHRHHHHRHHHHPHHHHPHR